jgi:hypothetical protein
MGQRGADMERAIELFAAVSILVTSAALTSGGLKGTTAWRVWGTRRMFGRDRSTTKSGSLTDCPTEPA